MREGIANRRTSIALTAAALLLASAASGAQAETSATVAVRAGSTVRVPLPLDHLASCSFHLSGETAERVDAAPYDEAAVEISPPSDARGGSYRVVVRCGGLATQHVTLHIIPLPGGQPRGDATGWRVAIVGRRTGSSSPSAARLAAKRLWAREHGWILAEFRNGQCTDWAAQKRPDVVQRVFEGTVVAELLGHATPPQLGDAQNWPAAAAAAGMSVSNRPVAGALVVWREGVEGASAGTGHIGYVESVAAKGATFATSEMNVGGLYLMGHRVLSSTPVAGRSFILP